MPATRRKKHTKHKAHRNRGGRRRRNGPSGLTTAQKAARIRGFGGSAGPAAYGVSKTSQLAKAKRAAAKRRASAKTSKRRAAARKAAATRKRTAAAKRRAAKKGRKHVAKKHRKKSHRKSAKRVAAGKKAARTRKRHKASRKHPKKRRKAKRHGKRRASGHGGKRRRRASLRTRRRGRGVVASCRPRGRKGRATLKRHRVGKAVIARCVAKNKKRKNKKHRRRNMPGFVNKILGYLPGGARIAQAVPYIAGGVVGVLGANVLPRFVPGGWNAGLPGVGLSLLGTGIAVWGVSKLSSRGDYALGAAIVGGFTVLAKLVANFTPAGSPIRMLTGTDLPALADYAGWDANGYNYGYGYDGNPTQGSDTPDEVTDAQVAGDLGMDDFLEIQQNGLSDDCMSIDDEDMADQVELRDMVEIR